MKTNMKQLLAKLPVLALALGIVMAAGCPQAGTSNGSDAVKKGIIPGKTPYTHPDLVWADEFDGDTLDLTKWNYDWGHGDQYGNGGWGNGEFQFYHPDNVIVRDGKLILEARQGSVCPCGAVHNATYNPYIPGPEQEDKHDTVVKTYGAYTSGKITTAGTKNLDGTFEPTKYMVAPGHRLEASIKVPRGRAFWPAFWGLGANVNEENSGSGPVMGWPRCGEIDIMETSGIRDKIYGVHLHAGMTYMDGYWNVGGDYEHETSLADDFYVYGVKWDDKDIIFYLQNKEQTETLYEWALNYEEREEIEANNHGGRWTAFTDTFYTQDFSIIFNFAISGAYTADHYNPYTDELSDNGGRHTHWNAWGGNWVQDDNIPVTWAVPPKDSAFTNNDINSQSYKDRTLQADWVRVHRWNRDAE